jgi:hypothetical protein
MSDNTVYLYQTFAEITKYTFDDFWKKVLLDCAKNKFPSGLVYDHTTNTIKVSSTKETVTLPVDEKELFQTMMSVFKKTGLSSDKFLVKYRVGTSSYKPKIDTRGTMISNFLNAEYKDKRLTPGELKQLHLILKIVTQFKFDMDIISFDEEHRKYCIDSDMLPKYKTTKMAPQKQNSPLKVYIDNWCANYTNILG